MAEKRRGLGRGLGALIPSAAKEDITASESTPEATKTAASAQTEGETRQKKQNLTVQKTSRENAEKTPAKELAKSSAAQQKSGKKSAPAENEQTALNIEAPQKNTKKVDSQQNVSRETPTSSTRSAKKNQRKDMGAALRSTTPSRRPVDFFFGEDAPTAGEKLVPVPGVEFAEVSVKDIHPNRKQPRSEFNEQDMEELVHSIKEIGVLQPIVIRPSREDGAEKYELVMGERRWRATQRAGLEKIPAIIRDTQDVDLLRDALLENLHRSQLNPIEEAAAYQQLLEEFNTTQDQLAQRIGRSRPQISNTLRLLKLPALVQRRVAAGILSSGHARALLGLRSQAEIEKVAQKIVNEGLSVRAVEEIVQSSSESTPKERKTPQPQKHHERLDYIADAFADKLDTNVKIQLGARKGKMTIEFASVEDLNRIISVLDQNIGQ
ncbi:ParB/RepB/Spo0J family partition protein [Rothia amarae]|uniref:ParB/RepB/Spo0J family partition protein n=1 Tax=Rothia amarae TaxID=169480 RepID=UPI0032172F94